LVKARVKTHLKIVNQLRLIEQLSLEDTLTNIPNRRNFDNRMILEWGRAIRDKVPLSVLMIDVDHFKIFNDTYGHQQGDKALQTVANAIRSALKRSSDFAARWGGEEFAVLLPNTDADGAMGVAERVRMSVEESMVASICNTTKLKVTISIGIATVMPSQEDTIIDLVRQADTALYTAKSMGRNRVCSK
jgi:diguanylate cyclase (GGDEF)-like protein